MEKILDCDGSKEMNKTFYVLAADVKTPIDSIENLSGFERIEANTPENAAKIAFSDMLDEIDQEQMYFWLVYDPEYKEIRFVRTRLVHHIDIVIGTSYYKELALEPTE